MVGLLVRIPSPGWKSPSPAIRPDNTRYPVLASSCRCSGRVLVQLWRYIPECDGLYGTHKVHMSEVCSFWSHCARGMPVLCLERCCILVSIDYYVSTLLYNALSCGAADGGFNGIDSMEYAPATISQTMIYQQLILPR